MHVQNAHHAFGFLEDAQVKWTQESFVYLAAGAAWKAGRDCRVGRIKIALDAKLLDGANVAANRLTGALKRAQRWLTVLPELRFLVAANIAQN